MAINDGVDGPVGAELARMLQEIPRDKRTYEEAVAAVGLAVFNGAFLALSKSGEYQDGATDMGHAVLDALGIPDVDE